jgi:Holliday junction resolvasome RuvABC endonuclease subunit
VTEFVWAVDVAVEHLSFAFAEHPEGPITTESLLCDSEFREGQRLGLLDRQVRIFAQQRASSYPPAVVWVEQPSGRFAKPQLMYAAGVVQAALFEALACPVWSVPVSKWKQWSVGKGNASKGDVMAWAVDHAGDWFDCQDEADAYAIAYAGRAMLGAGRWDVAA